MRKPLIITLALGLIEAGDVMALSVDEIPSPRITLLTVDDADDASNVKERIADFIDNGRRIAITGRPGTLMRMRPSFVHAWPTTNTVVLDPGNGLGVFGFDAEDDATRRQVLIHWAWSEEPFASATSRPTRAVAMPGRRHVVDFKVLAASPSQVCRDFSQKMATTMYGDRVPGTAQRQAFRREVRRWCQYGNLSVHTAEPAQFSIEPFLPANDLRLSLVTEWGLIRSEDGPHDAKVSYLFWTKTMGEGGGAGFTREHGTDAWYDSASGVMHGLLDAAIHSGWGDIEGRDVVTAWPLNSTFPHTGNVHVFRCDGPMAFRPATCPARPILRKLFPDDAVDGRVQVSSGEDIAIGGDVKVSRSVDTEGKNSVGITFGLNMLRTTTAETQADISLTHVRSNADTVFYRSTWWLPDVPAIQRWVAVRQHSGSLAKATHLAATLNPRHEILWEIPLTGNADRPLPYHVVYEAGWNTCANGTHCVDHRRQAGSSLPVKGRVGWSDGIVINLPSN